MKDRKRNSEENKEWVGPIYYSQHPNLKKLTPLEKKYLLAVEHGDAATVRRILMMKKRDASMDLDVNCKDPVGRSAMLMAIDNENLEMLQILIEFDVETSDALLHAINAEFVEAVELLLDHEEATHKDGEPHSWEKVDEDISAFTSEITPLILAAHKDNYEILKILLDRGATLPMPHDVRCPCNECAQALKEDCLCHSRSRINAYRALSSPSLICLSSIDPILTAFELSWELRRLSRAENEFKEDYQKLRIRCQDFATSLLAQTRSSRELGVILTHDPITPPPQDVETLPLTRVEMALKYKQKKFIAHPNVQQLMSTLWYDGLPGFRQLNLFQQLWVITKIGILFPFYSVLYMLSPHSETGKLIRKPFFKFILHSFSYLFFLFLLILASQRVETVLVQLFGTERMRLELLETLKKQRGQPPTVIETSILVFIIAHVWQETRELWKKGLINYFQNMWNVIDFTRNLLHVSTAGLRLLAYIQAQSEIRDNPMAVFIPREAWDAFDPTLIADGLFAAGNVFAALKLVHIFSINPYLGPLQISLGRMIIDIIKFFFIYTLVLFAFACGLNQLLWYYADMEKKQCFSGPGGTENWLQQRDSCLAWRRFSNLFESSQTLFWATFGLVDLSNFELTGIKSYTRFWGLLMFGSYSVINVVVLLNLLIAMMSNSYQIISERADEEWKFARTKLFMNYFEEGCTVPPPFNIFPTFKNIMRLFDKKSNRKSMSIRKKQNKLKERESIYQNVMCNLVWRYVTTQQKARECDAVTEDHINEVRQDLSSFRHDLMHILRCNGMNTRGVDLRKTDVTPGKIQVRKRRLIKDFSIGLMEVCAEDAAPEVRANKGVLARLVGLSSTDTGTCQRWRELIQLAKKSKMIGKESPGVSREASTVSEDTNETQQTGGDMEKVRVQGQNAPDIAPSKAEVQDKQITVTKLNEPNGCPPNITEEKTQVDMVTLSKGIALCAKSLLQSSAVDDAPKQGSPQKRPPSLYPQLSMEGRTKEATDRVQKSVTFETPPKCSEGKSSASGNSGKRSKTLAPSPPQRSTETPADGCTRRELPPSPGPKHAPQLPPDMKPLIDLSDVGMTSVAIDVPADSPQAASRKNDDNTRSSAQEKSVVVSILNSTESGTASDVKSQKRSDGAKSAIPIPQRKPRADDTKGTGSTPPSDVEGYRHGWI